MPSLKVPAGAKTAAAVADHLVEWRRRQQLHSGTPDRIRIAPDHRPVGAQQEKDLPAHRADRFVDVGEVADLDRDRDDAREGAALGVDALAEVDRERAAEPAGHRHVDIQRVVVDVAHVLEEVAVGDIRHGARPLPRRIDDLAVAPRERDRGRVRQLIQPLGEEPIDFRRVGAPGKIRGRVDPERGDVRRHVVQRGIDGGDRTVGLVGEQRGGAVGLAESGGDLVGAQPPRGRADRRHRQRDQADDDPDQAMKCDAAADARHDRPNLNQIGPSLAGSC